MRDIIPFVNVEKSSLVEELSSRISELYKERPESIALVPKRDRNGNVIYYAPEITKPTALLLLQFITSLIQAQGGSLKEDIQLLKADERGVILKASVSIEFGPQVFVFCEIGEAYTEEEDKDETPARRAYTRAFKRLIEKLVGEDFINRTLLNLTGMEEKRQEVKEDLRKQRPASERQMEIIKDFWRKGRLKHNHIQELKDEGQIDESFDLDKALTEGSLSDYTASLLLEKAGLARRK